MWILAFSCSFALQLVKVCFLLNQGSTAFFCHSRKTRPFEKGLGTWQELLQIFQYERVAWINPGDREAERTQKQKHTIPGGAGGSRGSERQNPKHEIRESVNPDRVNFISLLKMSKLSLKDTNYPPLNPLPRGDFISCVVFFTSL